MNARAVYQNVIDECIIFILKKSFHGVSLIPDILTSHFIELAETILRSFLEFNLICRRIVRNKICLKKGPNIPVWLACSRELPLWRFIYGMKIVYFTVLCFHNTITCIDGVYNSTSTFNWIVLNTVLYIRIIV